MWHKIEERACLENEFVHQSSSNGLKISVRIDEISGKWLLGRLNRPHRNSEMIKDEQIGTIKSGGAPELAPIPFGEFLEAPRALRENSR
jgi:hypothetical protein